MASPAQVPDALATRLVAEHAYVELRDRIVTLRLPPGTVLREDELMAELGIGRTPLREAVKRLALEGLVAVQPRRGTYVTEVDAAEIVHITGLLGEIERIGREEDHEALMALDRRIHAFIWDASGNPYLVDTLERYFSLSL